MEKLILRSIMYGADKIPDSWFEKVPGGYYRPTEKEIEESRSRSRSRSKGGQRQTQTKPRNGGDTRRRRDSIGEAFRKPPPDDSMFDEGYRSDGYARRRTRQGRNSYDGAENDTDDNSRGRGNRNDGDRYGRGDVYNRARHNDRYDGPDDRRMNGRAPYQPEDLHRSNYPGAAPYSPAGFAAGGTGTGNTPYPNSVPQSPNLASPLPSNAGVSSTGYVPYAHLYNQPSQNAPRQKYTPPGSSSHSSNSRERFNHPIAPQPWEQNVDAQQAETAAAAGAGMAYNGQPGFINTELYEPRYDGRRASHNNERHEDGYNSGYDGPPRDSDPAWGPHQRRDSRKDRSPSPNSYMTDSRDPRSRRTKSQGGARGKSDRIKDAFVTTDRGLGYGALGALAGGLLGSELEKGLVPTAIGAAVGALGANAFEARERRGRQQRQNQLKYPHDIQNARRDPRRSVAKEYGYYSD